MPNDTSLLSDVRPFRSGAINSFEIHTSGQFVSPDISGTMNYWNNLSGNLCTVVATTSGAFTPAGVIRVNVSGAAKYIPFFNTA